MILGYDCDDCDHAFISQDHRRDLSMELFGVLVGDTLTAPRAQSSIHPWQVLQLPEIQKVVRQMLEEAAWARWDTRSFE